jgi:hypothetical protein
LSSRFAAVRVRAGHRDEEGLRAPRAEQWLYIEWPFDQTEPTKYWLSTLPADTALVDSLLNLQLAHVDARAIGDIIWRISLGTQTGKSPDETRMPLRILLVDLNDHNGVVG